MVEYLEFEIYQFFKTISESFQASTLEIVIIFIALILFLGMLLGTYFYQKKKRREKRIEASQKLFESMIQKGSFSDEEKEILENLSQAVSGGKEKKHLLVKNPYVFSEISRKKIEEGEVSAENIEGIKKKLSECCFEKAKAIKTSDDLPLGLHLYIMQDKKVGFHGELDKKKPERLTIKLYEREALFKRGSKVYIYFKTKSATLYFSPEVLSFEPQVLEVSHPEKIQKVQRRKFYRKNISRPVSIRKVGERSTWETRTLDLGGGGMSIANPEGKFRPGERVALVLKLPEAEEIKLSGKIIRISKGTQRLHIKFDAMKESQRDKIIGFILH
jgi:hypothetical protein